MSDRTTGEKIATNISLIIIARLAMILALPIGGFMINRAINTVDDLTKNVSGLRDQIGEAGSNINLIRQSLTFQDKTIIDHEGRLRTLETYARNSMPRANAVPQ